MRKVVFLYSCLVLELIISVCSQTSNTETEDEENTKGEENINNEGNNEEDEANGVEAGDHNLEEEGLPEYNQDVADLGDTTIDVWLASDFVDQSPIVDAVEEFESVYSNVNVNVVGVPWEDIPDKIRKSVSGGNPPDAVHGDAYVMGAQGFAEPVNELWDKWGEEDKFLDGAINSITWEGNKYGMTIEINTTFYNYDKALFEEENVDVPTTIDELVEVSKQLTTDSRYGFVGESNGWNLYSFVVADGGDLIEELSDGTVQPSLNNDKVVEVVQKYTDLAKVDAAAPIPPAQARQQDIPIALFTAERAAGFVSGPWDLNMLESDFPDKLETVGAAVVPGSASGSVAGGGSLFVPKGSENKEAAFEFMKWISSEKYGLRLAEEMGRTPVRANLYDADIFNDPLLEAFVETLNNGKADWKSTGMNIR